MRVCMCVERLVESSLQNHQSFMSPTLALPFQPLPSSLNLSNTRNCLISQGLAFKSHLSHVLSALNVLCCSVQPLL